MANNQQKPLTPAVTAEYVSNEVALEKAIRRCNEAVEMLLIRVEEEHRELRRLKVKLEEMKRLAVVIAQEKGLKS